MEWIRKEEKMTPDFHEIALKYVQELSYPFNPSETMVQDIEKMLIKTREEALNEVRIKCVNEHANAERVVERRQK